MMAPPLTSISGVSEQAAAPTGKAGAGQKNRLGGAPPVLPPTPSRPLSAPSPLLLPARAPEQGCCACAGPGLLWPVSCSPHPPPLSARADRPGRLGPYHGRRIQQVGVAVEQGAACDAGMDGRCPLPLRGLCIGSGQPGPPRRAQYSVCQGAVPRHQPCRDCSCCCTQKVRSVQRAGRNGPPERAIDRAVNSPTHALRCPTSPAGRGSTPAQTILRTICSR